MKKLKLPALLLATAMVINLMPVNSFAIAESESEKLGYARKSKYVLYSSGSNAMQINASEAVVNGNLYTGADLAAYCGKTEVNGTVYIAGELRSGGSWSCYNLEEHSDKLEIIDFSESLINSLGEDYITHEYWYTYSGTTVTNNAPIYAKSGLQFCATDVTLDGTICSEEYLMISASDTFNSVEDGEMNLYCANGNIGIYAENIDIDGLIYAPNGTVQLCGTNVHIDGGIIAKEIQISAQYFTVNENLDLPVSEQIFNPDEHTLMASASYVEESDLFEVSLISTWPHGSYSVYVSENGTDYTLLGSTDKETYVFPYDATELYIKAVQTYEGDEILESNVVRIMYNEEEGYKEEYIDSDEDGLFDLHEHLLGTDIMNPDTDEDGISDYDEVFIFGTDPLYADSDEDGVIDSYEDDDNDGISNAEELVIGTNPSSSDTDDDGISDSDETNRYGTDPLVADMDDDGLSDSDEIALGLDPSVNDSDGDGILDDAEKFEQTYTYCTEEDVIEEIFIEMNATGNIQSTLTVESVMGIDVLSSSIEGLIGEPYSITTSSDFDEATVTFKINTENLEGELDEYCVIWYDGED